MWCSAYVKYRRTHARTPRVRLRFYLRRLFRFIFTNLERSVRSGAPPRAHACRVVVAVAAVAVVVAAENRARLGFDIFHTRTRYRGVCV